MLIVSFGFGHENAQSVRPDIVVPVVGQRYKPVTVCQDFSQTSTSIRQAWGGYIEDVNGVKFIPVARFFEPHN